MLLVVPSLKCHLLYDQPFLNTKLPKITMQWMSYYDLERLMVSFPGVPYLPGITTFLLIVPSRTSRVRDNISVNRKCSEWYQNQITLYTLKTYHEVPKFVHFALRTTPTPTPPSTYLTSYHPQMNSVLSIANSINKRPKGLGTLLSTSQCQ